MIKTFSFLDGGGDELKPTKDGLGWVCGEDIDVTRNEETDVVDKSTKAGEVEEEKSLEDEIGEGMLLSRLRTKDSYPYVDFLVGWGGGVHTQYFLALRYVLPLSCQENHSPLKAVQTKPTCWSNITQHCWMQHVGLV